MGCEKCYEVNICFPIYLNFELDDLMRIREKPKIIDHHIKIFTEKIKQLEDDISKRQEEADKKNENLTHNSSHNFNIICLGEYQRKIEQLQTNYYDDITRNYFSLNHTLLLNEEKFDYHLKKDTEYTKDMDLNTYNEFEIVNINERRKNFISYELVSVYKYNRFIERYKFGTCGEPLITYYLGKENKIIDGKLTYCSFLDPHARFDGPESKVTICIEIIKGKISYFLLDKMKNEGKMLVKRRLDKVEKFLNLLKGNLVLFCNERLANPKLKEIILGYKPPAPITESFSVYREFIDSKFKNEYDILNSNQKKALESSILTKDIWNVLGYPGSGKTSFIVLLIRILVAMGKKILVVTHTHSILDQILIKVLQYGDINDVLRVANNFDDVHPDIQKYVLNWRMYTNKSQHRDKKLFNTIKECRTYLENIRLCASTLGGLGQSMIADTKFDYCIIDEAGQALEPAILGAVLITQKLILIGDPKQVLSF
jgi:hypothetical protein